MQRGLDGGLSTAGVDDNVGASTEFTLLDQSLGVLLGGDALGEIGVGGSEVLGEVQLGLDNVNTDDLGGAECLCDGSAEQTDGSSTHHDNAGAGSDVGLLGNVNGDSEGLNESALLQGDIVGKLEAEVGGGGPESSQGAVVGRGSGEAHLGAQVVAAGQAVLAAAAGVAGLEGDAVASLEGLHGVTNLDDGTSGLVAKDHGVLDDKVANGTVLPVVDVGAADTGVVDGDENIVGVGELGDGALSELDVVGLVENEGKVLERSVPLVLEAEAVAKGELTLLPSVPAIVTVVRGGVVVGDLSLWFWRGRVSFHRGEKLSR